jgi:hypothetical protein
MLHLAVYHGRFEIVKLICEEIPNLDLPYAGKIPSNSGLANQSEISIQEFESSRPVRSEKLDKLNRTIETNRTVGSNFKVRSLILFWALDHGHY